MSDQTHNPTTEKHWARGFSLDRLRAVARRFQTHDADRCLGAFSKVKETAVATWLAQDRLVETADAVVAWRKLKSAQTVSDFRGIPILQMPAGSLIVERTAGTAQGIAGVIARLGSRAPVLWRSWADHPAENQAAFILGLERTGTLIRASSEIIAVRSRGHQSFKTALPSADLLGMAPVSDPVPTDLLTPLVTWIPAVEKLWQDHYSSYNKRKSWSAVALRSFGGDMTFIEKPAEMNRKYQQQYPERLTWLSTETPLMDVLPGARELLEGLGCPLERVRLMRLTQGGELSRHADITDRSAGTELGRIARFHLPIVTDPTVQFTSWNLDNMPTSVHMTPGRWWYLDVRKPHRAVNPSNVERVHLVADCLVTPRVRQILDRAAA
jgi:hypothetical protein